MRCTYCRPCFDHGRGTEVFSAQDLAFLVRHLHRRHGLRKVRLTGGEPTVRHDLLKIVASLSELSIPDGPEITLTTNGLTLARDALALRQSGIQRVNVSLDSLDPHRFKRMTGVDGISRVLMGIEQAKHAGFDAVKLNTVVVGGENENDLPALFDFAAEHALEWRLIELMPMGPLADAWQERYVPEARMRERLLERVDRWEPLDEGADAARRWIAHHRNGGRVHVGFITPMSNHFCDQCDRLRITADGSIYPCLMDEPRGNLHHAVLDRDAAAIDQAISQAMQDKAEVHPPTAPSIMTHLGG